MPSRESLSHELLAAAQELIEDATEIPFPEFLAAYQKKNWDQPNLSAQDLVAEVMEAAADEFEDDWTFDDQITIGATIMMEHLASYL
jgi:hypothetical protein